MRTYNFDGYDLDYFGARVTEITGLEGLKARSLDRTTWPGQHGSQPNRLVRRFQDREISMFLFFESISMLARQKASQFRALLYPHGRPVRLTITDDETGEVLSYDLDTISEDISDFVYNDMAEVQLKFVETDPIKNVYICNSSSASIAIASNNALQISWGDKMLSEDLFTGTYTHNYEDGKSLHYIIVSGVMEEATITGLTLLYTVRQ
ncbi:MAG: hypothetical protein PHE07_01610 [Bacteroidales bacterium]|nr:hypothetical protein [Bacteroidales bacterium]